MVPLDVPNLANSSILISYLFVGIVVVRKYIIKNKLFLLEDKLILAISGGADSVCLMHVLLEIGVCFDLAHCNFQLRGKESEDDFKFVSKWSKENKIPFFYSKFSTKKYLSDKMKIKSATDSTFPHRQAFTINVSNKSLSISRAGFVFRGARIFNLLPLDIRMCDKYPHFKWKARKWVKENIGIKP